MRERSKIACSLTVSVLHVLMSYLVNYGLMQEVRELHRERKTGCGSAASVQYVLSNQLQRELELRNCCSSAFGVL